MVWGSADVLRGVAEVVKWPFERLIWLIERGLVWPLEERTGDWGPPLRGLAVAGLALCAVGAGVLGLVWASGSGSGGSHTPAAAAPSARPAPRIAPAATPAPAAPTLQGAKPDFKVESGGGSAKSATATSTAGGSNPTVNSTAEVASSGSADANGGAAGAAPAESPGPAAIEVAHRFAAAFVLYEIGRESAKVRSVFNETATPQLAHSLLRRPPRQPAGAKVPKAKVLNVVAGPHRGDTYTLSVSLLRVGATSELRLEMQRDPKTNEWRVTEGLG